MRSILILAMCLVFNVGARGAWDVEYNLGSSGDGGLAANGFSLATWGGPLVETVMSDHVVVDGAGNATYPGGFFDKQDLGIGLNRSGPYTFEMTFATPGNQVLVGPIQGDLPPHPAEDDALTWIAVSGHFRYLPDN